VKQPTQKHFDTQVWNALRQFDPQQAVFVESESKKVGNLTVPEALVAAMRQSPCFNLVLPHAQRVALLLEDYDFFVQNKEHFCSRLAILARFHGKALVQNWQSAVRAGDVAQVVQALLEHHYDPVYLQSMQKNFSQFAHATPLFAADGGAKSLSHLAQELVQCPTTAPRQS
jgi:tRNA 2-selenouridine synthase